MASDSPDFESRAEIRKSFAWLQADTFSLLLLGTALILAGCIYPFLLRPLDFWPGWGVLLAMIALLGICASVRRYNWGLASALFVGTLLGGASIFLTTTGEHTFVMLLYVPIVMVAGALLGSRAAFLTALLASAVILLARRLGWATMGLSLTAGILALVWLTALTSWGTTRSLYTALHWAWSDQQRAAHNLQEAREYQGKLAATVMQLNEAFYRLERANHALAWARAEAEDARRQKAQFAAHVSHELRTPINLIVGFAELMLHTPEIYGHAPLPKPYRADLSALCRSAIHLQGLIDDILDLSQIEAGEMPVLKDITDVGAIVHEAVAIGKPLLERKNLGIKLEVDPDLPMLYLDRLRIRQVLLNLLNNAGRYTEEGQVTVRAYHKESEVVIEVADTGMGIEPQDLGRLFRPFQQLSTSPTKGRGGTGLGLAICKRFVELHGGRIWAQSEGIAGKGSVFGFVLPIQQDWVPAVENIPAGNSIGAKALFSPPAPTVVVEDSDPAIINLFQRHLSGYRIIGAATHAEATERIRNLPVHALITDLPAKENLELWHNQWSALAQATGTRILGCPMPSGKRAARTLGLVDYLVKPVTREALYESIQGAAPQAHTVLVVDDEPQMIRLLCQMLRSFAPSYELRRAYSGAQALESMQRARPDLVLLDLLMPQVDGFTVLERMSADPGLSAIPVIAVSAHGAVEAISPSIARTLVLISDGILPVSGLLQSIQETLDGLSPTEATQHSSAPEPQVALDAPEASG
jgi:signal transduction histidine kinase/CheY-like chemotaxis protein